MRVRRETAVIALVLCAGLLSGVATAWGQASGEREWTDLTGKFKVVGTMVEVKDGKVLIKNREGKMMQIPLERLSEKDQEFIAGAGNPFEMVESGEAAADTTADAGKSPPTVGAGTPVGGYDWSSPAKVDWGAAEEFQSTAGVEWNVPLPESGLLDFEPKRTAMAKKSTFHEGMLNDGSSVLMVGASDERGGHETPDQLQVWRFTGKKISRSASWVPYVQEKEEWGKQLNAAVMQAIPIRDDQVLTCSDRGHLVLWRLADREPIWHARLSGNFAIAPSTDRTLLAVLDEKALMILKTESAEILGSIALEQNTHVAWPRLAWSPGGKRLLLSYTNDLRVLDAEKGEWVHGYSSPSGPVAARALQYPHDDFALLDDHLLVHLPTKIQVCDYSGANQIETVGGSSFIGMVSDTGCLLAPGKFPHPAAEKLLEKAQSDPSVFLIHPGVAVSINVAQVPGQYQQAVYQGLVKSAQNSGYTVAESSPIMIAGSITGPKQEAVSYIASGSYVVNAYQSTIKLAWNGQDLWQTGGTNVPGVLMTKGGETIEQALAEAGKQPNLSVFENTKFPEFMQKPSDNQQQGTRSNALMTSQFTLQGLVDGK